MTARSPAPIAPDGTHGRRRRWRRWIALALVLVLSGWFGRFAWLRTTRRPTPRPDYWLAQLEALDPPPPGAISPAEAKRLLTSRAWEPPLGRFAGGVYPYRLLERTWQKEYAVAFASPGVFEDPVFVRDRAKLIQAARAGWRLPPRLVTGTFWGAEDECAWALWLLAHARQALRHDTDPATAAEDWLTALRIGRQRRRQQLWLDCRTEAAIMSAVADEVMRAARAGAWTANTAAVVREIDEIVGPAQEPVDLFRGEHIRARDWLESVYVQDGGDWLAVSELAERVLAGRGGVSEVSGLWNLASPLFHDFATAQREVEDAFAASAATPDLVSCTRRSWGLAVSGPQTLSGLPMSGDSPLPNSWLLVQYYGSRCRLEAAKTMLALAEYRHHHEAYPESLDQLIPGFMPRLPVDYADRKPLRYRRNEDDYLLYSVGFDGKDEDGKGSAPDLAGYFGHAVPDVVFSDVRGWEGAP